MSMKENRAAILAVAIVVSLVLGILYAFSIFTLPLEKTFGWTRTQVTMTFSWVLIFMSLGMLTGGNVIAKVGPRMAATIGGLILAAGFFLASYTTSLGWLYFTYGAMGGYGIGLANIVPMSILMRWFPDKKGLASGLITMALAFGTLILGSMLAAYWVKVYDWSTTLKILSVIFLVVVVGGSQFFNFPPAGYKPEGWTPPAGQSTEMWGYNRVNMAKTKACWMIFLWIMCIHFGAMMIISSVVPLATEKGVEAGLATMAMGIYAIANGLGRLFFASLCDKVGRRLAMTLDAFFMGAGLLGMVFLFDAFGYPGLVVSLILVGMAYGGTIPQSALLANSFFGPKFFPKNYGFYTIPGGIVASFMGPTLGGYIRDLTGVYTSAILVAAAITIVSLVMALTVQPPPPHTDEA